MIKIIPGKTNLLGYLDWEGDTIDENSPPAWTDMDDTSGWIIADGNRVVGEIDWSFSKSECNLDGNDIFLERIDIRDKGKGYGRAAMDKKHSDWLSEGFDSVSLLPLANPMKITPPEEQKRLVDWYKGQGYEKSNKCLQHTNCDNDLTCYLTKTLF